ncbi:MAG: hypothetical protein RR531_14380 [Longicatena sp.]
MNLNEFFQSKENNSKEKKWNVIEANILENYNIYNSSPYLKNNFYISTYQCPHCEGALYKTVFKYGDEYPIQTQIRTINLKRVFTCSNCLSFFSAIPGFKLNEGILFKVKYDNVDCYNKKLNDMNLKGSTDGRNDL